MEKNFLVVAKGKFREIMCMKRGESISCFLFSSSPNDFLLIYLRM